MNEFQLAMIGFGALLVAVVWGYNLWQEKKQRRQVESALPPAKPDVLMAGRTEPGSEVRRESAPAMRREPEFGPAAVFREPTFGGGEPQPEDEPPVMADGPAPAEQAADEPRPAVPLPAEWADGRADCLLRVEFVDPVPVGELWAEQAAWSPGLDKPVQWLGFDEHGGVGGRWRNLLPQDPGGVIQVAAALQLADRRGALSEATLTAFLNGMHKLAQRFSGLVELPQPGPVIAAARELDAFCAGVDVQLALHVIPRPGSLTSMVGARLLPVIEANRLKREGERFVAEDATGAEAFALTWETATASPSAKFEALALTGLGFSIDVPRVADGQAAFERMVACAKQCADALGGQLSDAQRKPLADATVAAIRARIGELQASMDRMGIPAGGVRALRLFS
jgi:hypothetical protein